MRVLLLALFLTLGAVSDLAAAASGPWLGQREPGLQPEIFAPGLVSLPGRREGGATFSPDGRSFYFTFGGADGTFATHAMFLRDDGWSAPVRASFVDQGNTGEAFITASGRQLYFASSRPPGTPPWNNRIWVTDLEGDGWGRPRLVELGIETNHGVFFPTVSRDGILYVGSQAEKSGLPNLRIQDAVLHHRGSRRQPDPVFRPISDPSLPKSNP